ncbi:MAG: 3-deoxy-8-phosphooctulonate synthase [Acidobacteriota bacterium]
MSDASPSIAQPEDGILRRQPTIALSADVELGGESMPIIAGPCVIEGAEALLEVGEEVAALQEATGASFIFKASFDKANRSSLQSFRGIGFGPGLEALAQVRETTGLPLLTDVHEPRQCARVAEVVDVLQIPAFLCRQTDLLVAAAETGKAVNIKKGQFVAPDDMLKAVDKARSTGNTKICVTERGFSFGYHNMVVDMRSFATLQGDGIPVIFDVTHSLQLPGGGTVTGGARRFAEPLARAAVAAGCDGLFMEVHPDPATALSDATTQLPPGRALLLAESLLELRRAVWPHLRATHALHRPTEADA